MNLYEVSPSEWLSRFITQKSYYRPSNHPVRHNAFMPNRQGKNSLYRIDDLHPDEEIFKIGEDYVAKPQRKPLLGRADIVSSVIMDLELRIEPAPDPHPRHADIVDWPADDSKHKLIAIEIAEKAQLHLIDKVKSNT